jgi:hypothetical protein
MEFTGGAVEAAVARLLRSPRIPEDLGEPWAPLLSRMTARDAADRPTAAEVLGVLRGELPAAGTVPAQGGPTEVLPPASAPSPTRVLPAGGSRPTTARTPVVGQGVSTAPWAAAPLGHPKKPPTGARTAGQRRTHSKALVRAAIVVGIIAALLVVVPLALRASMMPPSPAQPVPASPAAPAGAPSTDPGATHPGLTRPATSSLPSLRPGKAKGKDRKPHEAPLQGGAGG